MSGFLSNRGQPLNSRRNFRHCRPSFRDIRLQIASQKYAPGQNSSKLRNISKMKWKRTEARTLTKNLGYDLAGKREEW